MADEIIDLLLDQEGFECDPVNTREGDTPLHSAVRWVNSLPDDPEQQESAIDLIEMMLEAGSDPRFVAPINLEPPSSSKISIPLPLGLQLQTKSSSRTDTNCCTQSPEQGSSEGLRSGRPSKHQTTKRVTGARIYHAERYRLYRQRRY